MKEIQLLFADSFDHAKQADHVDTVSFPKIVSITECYVVPKGEILGKSSNISGLTCPAKFAFSIYATRDEKGATMEKVAGPIEMTPGKLRISLDGVSTNRIAIRGSYQAVTLAVYGRVLTSMQLSAVELKMPQLPAAASTDWTTLAIPNPPQSLPSIASSPTDDQIREAREYEARTSESTTALGDLANLFLTFCDASDPESFNHWSRDLAVELRLDVESLVSRCVQALETGDSSRSDALRLVAPLVLTSASAVALFISGNAVPLLLSAANSGEFVSDRSRALAALAALGGHGAGMQALIDAGTYQSLMESLLAPVTPPVVIRASYVLKLIAFYAATEAVRNVAAAEGAELVSSLQLLATRLRRLASDAGSSQVHDAAVLERGAWALGSAMPMTASPVPLPQLSVSLAMVRLLRWHQIPQVLATVLCSPTFRTSQSAWLKLFAPIRDILLTLLQSRGGLLLLAHEPEAVGAIVEGLRSSDPIDTCSLPLLAARPSEVAPSALARVLAVHMHAIGHLDEAVSASSSDNALPFLAQLCEMRTQAAARHAVTVAVCMPEGLRLLSQLLRLPARPDHAVSACTLIDLIVQDTASAGVLFREGVTMRTMVQAIASADNIDSNLRKIANVLVAVLAPCSTLSSGGASDLIDIIKNIKPAEPEAAKKAIGFSTQDATVLTTCLRLLYGIASSQPDACASIVSADGFNVLVQSINNVASVLEQQDDDNEKLPLYRRERTHILIATSCLQTLEAVLSRLRAAQFKFRLTPLWEAMIRLAAVFGNHAAFMAAGATLPASGLTLLLRDAWDALISVGRHWVGTAWVSFFPKLCDSILSAPRCFIGCTALLRDLLPPTKLPSVSLLWPSPALPPNYNFDLALVASQLGEKQVCDLLTIIADTLSRTAIEELHELFAEVFARVCEQSLLAGTSIARPFVDVLTNASSGPLIVRLLRIASIVLSSPRGKVVLVEARISETVLTLARSYAEEPVIVEAAIECMSLLCESHHGVGMEIAAEQRIADNLPKSSILSEFTKVLFATLEQHDSDLALKLLTSLCTFEYGLRHVLFEEPLATLTEATTPQEAALSCVSVVLQRAAESAQASELELPRDALLLVHLLLRTRWQAAHLAINQAELAAVVEAVNQTDFADLAQEALDLHSNFTCVTGEIIYTPLEQRDAHARFDSGQVAVVAYPPEALPDDAVLEDTVEFVVEDDGEAKIEGKRSALSTDSPSGKKQKIQGMFTNVTRQPFRTRKQNTSRLPSMHVDDFVKKPASKPASGGATATGSNAATTSTSTSGSAVTTATSALTAVNTQQKSPIKPLPAPIRRRASPPRRPLQPLPQQPPPQSPWPLQRQNTRPGPPQQDPRDRERQMMRERDPMPRGPPPGGRDGPAPLRRDPRDLPLSPRDMGPPHRNMGPPHRDMGPPRDMPPRDMPPRDMGPRDMGPRDMGPPHMGPPRDMGPRDMGPPLMPSPRDMRDPRDMRAGPPSGPWPAAGGRPWSGPPPVQDRWPPQQQRDMPPPPHDMRGDPRAMRDPRDMMRDPRDMMRDPRDMMRDPRDLRDPRDMRGPPPRGPQLPPGYRGPPGHW